jgi:hypothetical protein
MCAPKRRDNKTKRPCPVCGKKLNPKSNYHEECRPKDYKPKAHQRIVWKGLSGGTSYLDGRRAEAVTPKVGSIRKRTLT